jgi:hypothetical protein
MSRRREFIALVGAGGVQAFLGVLPIFFCLARHAASRPSVRRPTTEDSELVPAAFVQGLQELGWTVSRNLQIDYRWSNGTSGGLLLLGRWRRRQKIA